MTQEVGMGGFGEGDRWRDAMFDNGNRVHFERPVDDAGRQWWLEAFYDPYDLSPESMGDLLTQSVTRDKSIVYRFVDGADHSFALRVQGRFQGDGQVWFVERSFRLEGTIFSADEMFVPAKDARAGRGRLLMNDLFMSPLRCLV
jgi:hypothetical protein